MNATQQWLEEHSHEYAGQWIAVYEGQLLGTATTLRELRTVIHFPEHPLLTTIVKVLPKEMEIQMNSTAIQGYAVNFENAMKEELQSIKEELVSLRRYQEEIAPKIFLLEKKEALLEKYLILGEKSPSPWPPTAPNFQESTDKLLTQLGYTHEEV